ncbi:MAG: hypothetical protein ACRD45_00180 [Bryobacteraceae bacterium]
MGEIRKFEESHIPEVAALELKIFHQSTARPPDRLVAYFREIFFQNPWREEELPSFVYIHNSEIVGFLGVIPRRMQFRGEPIRLAVISQLMADRDRYRGFAGLELMKRSLAGPQDLSYTDGATEAAYAIWTAAGGRVLPVYGLRWRRILRPARYFRSTLGRSQNRSMSLFGSLLSPLCGLADTTLARSPYRAFQKPQSALHAAPAAADALFDCIQEIGWREELRPAYDRESFRWLITQAATATAQGGLRAAVLRNDKGRFDGSFVYYLKPEGVSNVLQIASRPRAMGQVLAALFRDAWEQGAIALMGQALPKYPLEFARSYCDFHYPGNGVIMHSRNPEIANCVLRGDAALSLLDGEWWTRFVSTNWLAETNQAAIGCTESMAVLR